MKYTIEINCDNDAFGDDPTPEVARILHKLADQIETCAVLDGHILRDANGNRVGQSILQGGRHE